MVSYKCEQCNKIFHKKSHYTNHINRKRPCTKVTPNSTKITPNSTKNEQIVKKNANENAKEDVNNKQCPFCKKIFTRPSSVDRHLDGRCKVKQKQENNKKEKIDELVDEIKEIKQEMEILKKENTKLKQVTNIGIQNNTNIENQQNIQVNNINILNCTKADLTHITDKIYKFLFGKVYSSVPKLIKLVHCNKDKPENHNIYVSNMKDKFVHVYENENWTLENEDILETMIDRYMNILTEKYKEMKPELGDGLVIDYDKLIDEHEERKYYNAERKEIIKLILYNAKESPKKIEKEWKKTIKNDQPVQ